MKRILFVAVFTFTSAFCMEQDISDSNRSRSSIRNMRLMNLVRMEAQTTIGTRTTIGVSRFARGRSSVVPIPLRVWPEPDWRDANTTIKDADSSVIKAAKRKNILEMKREINCVMDQQQSFCIELLHAYQHKLPWSTGRLQQHVDTFDNEIKKVIDAQDEDGNTPLLLVAKDENETLGKYLIDYGADVNKVNNNGNTPLIYATYRGSYELVKYLIRHGASVNKENNDGNTPLICATEREIRFVEYLVEHGADVNGMNKEGYTPLLLAVGRGNCELVNYLIHRGALVNQVGVNGYTPLLYATTLNNSVLARLLVEDHGADVNPRFREFFTNTPLLEAADKGNYELVRFFVEHGANLHETNGNGETALQIVRRKAREIEDYLIGQGAH